MARGNMSISPPAPLVISGRRRGSFFFPEGEGAPFTGVLDAFGDDLAGVWAVARLLTAWEGPLVRVRRSGDSAEQDIGFLANGRLDVTALAAFVGGGTGYVAKVYDQTGGGNDLVNASASAQPVMSPSVAAFGNTPAWTFDGTNDDLAFEASLSPIAILAGVHSTGSSGLGRYVSHTSGNSSLFETSTSGAYGRFGTSTGQVSVVFADPTVAHGLEAWYNSGESIIRLDTAEEPSAADSPLETGSYTVGSYSSSFQYIIGSMAYVVMFNTFLGAPQRAAIRAGLANLMPTAV